MPRQRLTEKAVASLKADGQRIEIYDTLLPGFGRAWLRPIAWCVPRQRP